MFLQFSLSNSAPIQWEQNNEAERIFGRDEGKKVSVGSTIETTIPSDNPLLD
jgi:hypothetical protein